MSAISVSERIEEASPHIMSPRDQGENGGWFLSGHDIDRSLHSTIHISIAGRPGISITFAGSFAVADLPHVLSTQHRKPGGPFAGAHVRNFGFPPRSEPDSVLETVHQQFENDVFD